MNRATKLALLALILVPIAARNSSDAASSSPLTTFRQRRALHDRQELTDMTTHIVAHAQAAANSAVGFVNENKLYMHVGEVDARIARSINGSTPVSNSATRLLAPLVQQSRPQGFRRVRHPR